MDAGTGRPEGGNWDSIRWPSHNWKPQLAALRTGGLVSLEERNELHTQPRTQAHWPMVNKLLQMIEPSSFCDHPQLPSSKPAQTAATTHRDDFTPGQPPQQSFIMASMIARRAFSTSTRRLAQVDANLKAETKRNPELYVRHIPSNP